MTRPEDAIQRARESVAKLRATGTYGEAEGSPASATVPGASRRKLLEWALIEPDEGVVRSTRRRGGAITALKRGLLRLLAQYHAELIANQSRFNLALMGHLEGLEQRVEALEQRTRGEPDP